MFRKLNETELAIRDIRDVRMIHIYGLRYDVPAIAVFYGRGQQFNLSCEDEYFNLLSERIFQLYDEAENKDSIITDDTTRSILEAGSMPKADDGSLEAFAPFSAESDGIPMDSALSKRFLPIAVFLLKELYSSVGRTLTITGTKTGWRGAGAVYGLVTEERKSFTFRVTRLRSDLYNLSIGNFLRERNTLNVRISFGPDSILMSYSADYEQFNGTSRYVFNREGMTETHSVFCSGEQVYKDTKSTDNHISSEASPEASKQALSDLLGGCEALFPKTLEPTAAYQLPFGMTYVLCSDRSASGEAVTVSSVSGFIYTEAGFADYRRWVSAADSESGLTIRSGSKIIHRLMAHDGSIQTLQIR